MTRLLVAALALLTPSWALAGSWALADNAGGQTTSYYYSPCEHDGIAYLPAGTGNDLYVVSSDTWSTIARPSTSELLSCSWDASTSSLVVTGTDSTTRLVASFWYSTLPISSWTGPRTLANNGRIRGLFKGTSAYFMGTSSSVGTVGRLLTSSALTANPTSHSDITTDADTMIGWTVATHVVAGFNFAAAGRADSTVSFRGWDDGGTALFATVNTTGVSTNSYVSVVEPFSSESLGIALITNLSNASRVLGVDSSGTKIIDQDLGAAVFWGGVEWNGAFYIQRGDGQVWKSTGGDFANVSAMELSGESGTLTSFFKIGSDFYTATGAGELWKWTSTGPTAAFSCTPTTGVGAQSVACTDASAAGDAAITAWSWTGDCGTSSSQSPTLSCPVGANDITLTVTTAVGSDQEAKSNYVNLAPLAAFSCTPLSGEAPLEIACTDASSGASSWLWGFDDGEFSSDQNPTHIYAVAESYTIELTATGAGGSDMEVKTDYVTVSPAPSTQHAPLPRGFRPCGLMLDSCED